MEPNLYPTVTYTFEQYTTGYSLNANGTHYI